MLSLPSVFQIPLEAPLHCSCPLFCEKFLNPSNVYFLCLLYFCASSIFPVLQAIQS